MKYLSRNDLETIGGRVIAAYKRLPAISDQALERVDIDFLCQELLGLCMEYDDSIVRQMVECIKVYPGGKLEIIFGGGYLVEESV